MKETLSTNYNNIKKNIYLTCEQNQINPNQITTVCVSKHVSIEIMEELYQLGIRNFAENRPKVFLEKYNYFSTKYSDITWHYIGNLQKRPVKEIINLIDYIHSIDRISLAEEIQKRRQKPLKSFIQVNISGESTKSGFSPEQLLEQITEFEKFDRIALQGLMTMAPSNADSITLHHIFKSLRNLLNQIHIQYPNLPIGNELSMGMSRDYIEAIEEGGTFIRVGSAFFDNLV